MADQVSMRLCLCVENVHPIGMRFVLLDWGMEAYNKTNLT